MSGPAQKPDKKVIAEILEEIATLLAIHGENVYKVRAYENAARALQRVREPLEELIRSDRLRSIRGIGASTARVIQTVYETGEIPPILRELREKTPPELLELLEIPGLGPQRVHVLYQKLGVRSVADLKYMLETGALAQLEGFGPRTVEKIREGIEQYEATRDYFLLGVVYPIAQALETFLQQIWSGPVRIVGSVRRWCPVVRNINILLQGQPDPRVRDQLITAAPIRMEVLETEATTWRLRVVPTGIPVHLVWVVPADWPWAVRYWIGSREHNQQWHDWTVEQGYTWSGIRMLRDSQPVALPESVPRDIGDEPIFAALGLAYLPPEVREGRGEIARAVAGTVPRLIGWSDIRGVVHVHTHYSDGADSLLEMLKTARAFGLEYVGISDHSPAAHYANGLDRHRLLQQWQEMDVVQQQIPEVRILRGMEVDILPDGSLDMDDDLLERMDFVVASVHSRFQMGEREMTERIIRAMRHPCATILGHPTGRLLLGRKGYAVNLDRVFEVAAETGTLIEINANPHRLDLDWTLIEKARSMGVRFSIDPDTHRRADLRDYIYGVGIARKGWLTAEDVANTRSWPELLEWFHQIRARKMKQNG